MTYYPAQASEPFVRKMKDSSSISIIEEPFMQVLEGALASDGSELFLCDLFGAHEQLADYPDLVFEPIVTWFSDKFDDAREGIYKAFQAVGTWFSERWDDVKNAFANVNTWFSDTFSDAWQAVKDVFASWGEFFSGLWETIKTTFSDLGTDIANAIGGAVKSGINGVISMIENTINSAVSLINGAIGLINLIPGVSVGYLSDVYLPRLARGGVLERGQVGILEGDGAEAVVPLEQNTKWIRRVAAEMQASMMTQNTDLIPVERYDHEEMVSAFKDALKEVDIVLDSDVAGRFVDRTVRRAVYYA